MDAQEVKNHQRHQHQWVSRVLLQCRVMTRNQITHRRRRQVRRHRSKADARCAAWMPLDNIVIACLPVPTRLRQIAVENAVQLQNHVFRKRHFPGVLVNQ